MPMLIEHIDALARQKQRDVLYLTFHPKNYYDYDPETGIPVGDRDYNFHRDPIRDSVCQWLTEHGIAWQPCGHFAQENTMRSYLGQIYLDVPFDEDDPQYQLVRDYLENPDGTMRLSTVNFYYLPLEEAMKNAHHDEPGFWDKWAESF